MIHHQHHGSNPCLHCDNAALKAEVERLTTLATGRRDSIQVLCEQTMDQDEQIDALKAEVAELRQRDRLISNQLERRADGMDPLAVHLRAEVERLHGLWVEAGNARIRLEEENAKLRGYANQTTSASEEPPA